MHSPSKRVASNDTHSAPTESPEDAQLRASLVGAAMRARQNVARGYATNRSLATPNASPTKPTTNALFASEADTLHSVFAALPPGSKPPTSPGKRSRPEKGDRDADGDSDIDFDMADSTDHDLGHRKIKPLKKALRPKIEPLRFDS